MKRAAALLLLLIGIACSVTPCCLVDDCAAEQGLPAADNHGDDKDAGNCSPFAACAACSGFVKLCEPAGVEAPVQPVTIQRFPTHTEKLSGYSTSFWQPPRG